MSPRAVIIFKQFRFMSVYLAFDPDTQLLNLFVSSQVRQCSVGERVSESGVEVKRN